ncbi:scavenger receptor class F member 2-like [Sycon ciliatum]|uniref:scavenger receptor class F member 2-like n=1 Tax=Sycon ciliatum TaxID=27933 RepID=UPI0031F5F1A6
MACTCDARSTRFNQITPDQPQTARSTGRRRTRWTPFDSARLWIVLAASLHMSSSLCSAMRLDGFGRSVPEIPGQCDHSDWDSVSCTDSGRDVTACTHCLPGEWCRSVANASVSLADIGTNASFVCEPCPAGCFQSSPGQQFCLVCHGGNFSATCNQSSCQQCEAGQYSAKDNEAHTECDLCTIGTNQTRKGKESCSPCPPNTMCNHTACGDCKMCYIGQEAYANRSWCQPCQAGSHNPGYLKYCRPCDPGFACNFTSCAICEPCQPGQFAHRPASHACAPCPLGHYQDQLAGSVCHRCPKGFYATEMGRPDCIECGVGYYCPTAENPPRPCPNDAYCPKGSEEPQYCPAMYNLNTSENGCTMSGGLICIIAATLLANIIIITLLIWHYYRKKKLYTGGESRPLMWRKETQTRDPPEYDGF